jgi:hypothetical protein
VKREPVSTLTMLTGARAFQGDTVSETLASDPA